MNKFLKMGDYVFGGSIVYVGESGGTLTLNYEDKAIALTGAGSFTAADKTAVENALVSIWSKSYTNSTIDVTLSQAITTVA
mgnify:CR=1 FL=1|tara:strand:+ start:303 stop:545 length:243 start_codon:yes stop_codon:yes gene_type:complete